MTEQQLYNFYIYYNCLYWQGKLPAVRIEWCSDRKMKEDLARTVYRNSRPVAIWLNRCIKPWESVVLLNLLHEMCHVASVRSHGPKFQREMLRLAKAGAFKDLW